MPTIKVKPLSRILLDSAPQQGDGLHNWLIKGARECTKWRKTPEQAYDLIRQTVLARGGEERPHDIWQAINKAYSTSFSAGDYKPAPKWPEADLGLIEDITLDAIDRCASHSLLDSLWQISPEKPNGSPGIAPETTSAIVRRLFPVDRPDNPILICAGIVESSTTTYELARIEKRLHKFPLLVPNPMSAKIGKTQEGHYSGRTLNNTGPRRFLITEFDFKRTDKQGKLTKWAPLIDTWQKRGATVQDACAALILHLMKRRPLAMVVYSGKKSLHGWWFCAGESGQEGSPFHNFAVYAATIGADTSTYRRCQFVRMPGAVRPDIRRQQTVHFLDFKHVEGINR